MYSLTLISGRPGANKTLNTLKMIIEDKEHQNRVVFYHNVPLMFLDYSLCDSFEGFYYGVFRPSLSGAEYDRYQLLMERCHNQGRRVQLSDVPHLEDQFDSWSDNGPLELWLSWCRRVYPAWRLNELENYLAINPNASFQDLEQFNLHWVHFDDPRDWFRLPRPCRIVIDECQRWFNPRSVGAKVPQHISEFETVRHSGGDVFLITQHPKLIDSNIRRLVVNHFHFVRKLGGKRVIRYSWSGSSDNPEDYHSKQESDKSTIQADSKFFGLYHSADRHNYKFKLPRKAWFFIVCFALAVMFVVLLVVRLASGRGDDSDGSVTLGNLGSGGSSNVVAQVTPGKTSSPGVGLSGGGVLPVTALASVDHPLSSLCEGLSLAGHEDVSSGGITVRRFYVNCLTSNTVTYKSGGESNGGQSVDSDEFARESSETSSETKSYQERLMFSFEELTDYGYSFTMTQTKQPVLVYQGREYLLVSY